jgi:hypothetical protein
MTLDIDPTNVRATIEGFEAMAWSSQDPRYYDESWFSIVSDTLFYDDHAVLVTEKVMKPIMQGAPYVYFGGPRALAHLHSWGFEPLGGAFAADYDRLTDPTVRMNAALEAAERVLALDEPALREEVRAAWPVCEHNHWHFWSELPKRLGDGFRTQVLDVIGA